MSYELGANNVYRLPFTDYRLMFTVYRLPINVYRKTAVSYELRANGQQPIAKVCASERI